MKKPSSRRDIKTSGTNRSTIIKSERASSSHRSMASSKCSFNHGKMSLDHLENRLEELIQGKLIKFILNNEDCNKLQETMESCEKGRPFNDV